MSERFIPPHPPRRAKPVHTLRGFFGERARTAVYGWSELAFNTWHVKRVVLGHPVHIVLKPEWVQRVLLDNAANYEKPRLVKRILAPTIGRGLLSSDGELWRAQRKIVAASFTPPAVDALVPVFARVGQALADFMGSGHARHGCRGDHGDDERDLGGFVQRRRAADQPGSHGPHHRSNGGRVRSAHPGAAGNAADSRSLRADAAGVVASNISATRWGSWCASGLRPALRRISSPM